MNIDDLTFTSSPLNTACDAIIARLSEAVDDDGLQVFQSVTYGLDIPSLTILGEECPALRIWQDSDDYELEATHFFVGQATSVLSFYLYFHALPDSNNVYPDIQQKRTEIVKFLLRTLEYPAIDNVNGFTPDNSWWVDTPQTIRVDHTTAMRRIAGSVEILPPWYVTRIDLKIKVKNYP